MSTLFARGFAIVVVAASSIACSSSGDGGATNQSLTNVYAADAAGDAVAAVAADANAVPDAAMDAPTDAPVADAAADAADGACPCGVVAPYECKLLVDHCAKDPNCLDCKEIPKACACAPCHDGGTHCGH